MKHISEMSQLFANVVSRDQILKDRVIEYIRNTAGIELQNKQVMIGQTVVVLQQLTFAERTVIQQKYTTEDMIEYINKNEHNFTIQDIIIR